MDIRKITKRAAHAPEKPFHPDAGRSRGNRALLQLPTGATPHLDQRRTIRRDATILPPGAPGIVDREEAADADG
ncbi:MAG TPA: hypothetical protein VL687_05155 [Methylomirabilota bacterium]|nr:hypothetical protein [Methylomirabilota bacterium]